VQEVPFRRNEKIVLGEVFHATLQEHFTRQINGCRPADAETVAFFSDAFDRLAAREDIDWQVPRCETRARGVAMVKYFLDHLAPDMRPLMVEKELSAELPGSGVVLKGVIDLVETDFSITDFKTTTSRWSPGRARNSLQMTIYKYLFDHHFGHVHAALKYEVLYARKPESVRHQSLPVSPGPEEIRRLLELVGHVAENIAAAVFHPNRGPFCAHCPFVGPCRENQPGPDPANTQRVKKKAKKP
jgi:hypothetical protein